MEMKVTAEQKSLRSKRFRSRLLKMENRLWVKLEKNHIPGDHPLREVCTQLTEAFNAYDYWYNHPEEE